MNSRGRGHSPVGEEEPEGARVGAGEGRLDVAFHPLGVGEGLRRPARLLPFKLRDHVVERREDALFERQLEFYTLCDAAELDAPTQRKGAHR